MDFSDKIGTFAFPKSFINGLYDKIKLEELRILNNYVSMWEGEDPFGKNISSYANERLQKPQRYVTVDGKHDSAVLINDKGKKTSLKRLFIVSNRFELVFNYIVRCLAFEINDVGISRESITSMLLNGYRTETSISPFFIGLHDYHQKFSLLGSDITNVSGFIIDQINSKDNKKKSDKNTTSNNETIALNEKSAFLFGELLGTFIRSFAKYISNIHWGKLTQSSQISLDMADAMIAFIYERLEVIDPMSRIEQSFFTYMTEYVEAEEIRQKSIAVLKAVKQSSNEATLTNESNTTDDEGLIVDVKEIKIVDEKRDDDWCMTAD